MGDLDERPPCPALTNLMGTNLAFFAGLILLMNDFRDSYSVSKTKSCLMVYLPSSSATEQPERICDTVACFLEHK